MTLKYRRLNSQELQQLEKEFVDFLVINGIAADDWVAMKEKELNKANQIIDLFSDVIFEGVVRKVRFLEHISASSIYCFQLLEKEIQLIGLEDESGTLDFTQIDFSQQSDKKLPVGLKVFFNKKAYQKDKNQEIFKLMENGAILSNGQLYKQLSLLYASSQKG